MFCGVKTSYPAYAGVIHRLDVALPLEYAHPTYVGLSLGTFES